MLRGDDVMDRMQTQELISAMADGQVRGEAFARGVEVAASDPVALEAWHTYHLIGDVLRSGELTMGTVPAAFLSRLQVRLQEEQQLAPTAQAGVQFGAMVSSGSARRSAANDASFRWKL